MAPNSDAVAGGEQLVRQLATHLYRQAQAHVPDVLGGRTDTVPPHIAEFIRAQRTGEEGFPPLEHFQLPEPILGPIPNNVQVLVIGLNPGYGPTEAIPTLSSSVDEYVGWYQTRMDCRDEGGRPVSWYAGQRGIVRHYVAVERDYLTPVLNERALGRTAVYADAIPWKWNRECTPPLRDSQIGLDARARVGLIASTLQPDLLLVFGGEPAKQLGTPWPSSDPAVQSAVVGDWQGQCLAVAHPNKHWRVPGEKAKYLKDVGAALGSALKSAAF